LMTKTAVIGIPEVKLGAIPGAGGVQKLGRYVGRAKALEWILLGTQVSAAEAERRGLVYAVTASKALLPTALALAEKIKALSPRAIAHAKASVLYSENHDLKRAEAFGLDALRNLIGSADWQEG